MAEPFGMGGVGAVQGLLALRPDVVVGAVVDRGRGVQADPGVAVLVVVVAEKCRAEGAGVSEANRSGKTGAYFRVLNTASL